MKTISLATPIGEKLQESSKLAQESQKAAGLADPATIALVQSNAAILLALHALVLQVASLNTTFEAAFFPDQP